MHHFDSHMKEILFDEAALAKRVAELGAQITKDYQGREVILLSVLRGSFIFVSDLCRSINLDLSVDFMSVSSYGAGTVSSGQVQIVKDIGRDITGKEIIVVEDILDSGNTLSYLLGILKQRQPASLRICTLLDKPTRREKEVQVDYCGFEIPDAFVVGYGLDFDERYRNVPYIGVLKEEIYQ
ncbi:MAG: hypoxanthine phosphoribosyltransferase [Eubacteriales bacterium]